MCRPDPRPCPEGTQRARLEKDSRTERLRPRSGSTQLSPFKPREPLCIEGVRDVTVPDVLLRITLTTGCGR
eukprot:6554511-Pyramimonas_sp.AAC.3